MNKLLLFSATLVFLASLSGCAPTQKTSVEDSAVINVSWASIPQAVQNVAHAIGSMYGQADTKNTEVKQTWTGSDYKKMYLVNLYGNFHKPHVSAPAAKLSFSVLSDGSKVWGLTAANSEGKIVWQQNDFEEIPENLRYEGQSHDWKGFYNLNGVMIWTKDFTEYGNWGNDQFILSYLGMPLKTGEQVKYSLDTTVGGCGGTQDIIDGKTILGCGGGGNGAIPNKDAVMTASVEWDGHKESFQLKTPGK